MKPICKTHKAEGHRILRSMIQAEKKKDPSLREAFNLKNPLTVTALARSIPGQDRNFHYFFKSILYSLHQIMLYQENF